MGSRLKTGECSPSHNVSILLCPMMLISKELNLILYITRNNEYIIFIKENDDFNILLRNLIHDFNIYIHFDWTQLWLPRLRKLIKIFF